MNLKLLSLLGVLLFINPTFAFFEGMNSRFIEDALSLEVNKSGFEVLSKVAQERLLNNLENQEISDLNLSIPLVANVDIKRISFSAQFEKIKITPFNNGLDIDLGIKNLELNVGEVRFSNYFLPAIGTSCFGTKINIANGETLPIRARLGIRMENGLIKLKNNGFIFNMDHHQYRTIGPKDCIGAFGITDYLTKFFAENILSAARPAINLALNAGVDVLATDLGTLLFTQIDKFKLPLKVPNLLIIPEGKIFLGFRIQEVKISSEKMKLVLSLAVEKDNSKSDEEPIVPEILHYGTLGINPEFLTHLLSVVIPEDGTREIEITSDFHEMVAEILKISEFGNFIPDLLKIKTDTDQLRLFISFKKPPIISIKDRKLFANIPDLTMKLQIEQNGKWIDYTFIHVKTSFTLNVKIAESKIVVGLLLNDLNLTNEFAPAYKPIDNNFLATEFADSLKVIVSLFTENEDGGMKLDLPFFNVDDRKITLGDIFIKDPFLYIDIVGHLVH
jgi:hypothetical protein